WWPVVSGRSRLFSIPISHRDRSLGRPGGTTAPAVRPHRARPPPTSCFQHAAGSLFLIFTLYSLLFTLHSALCSPPFTLHFFLPDPRRPGQGLLLGGRSL